MRKTKILQLAYTHGNSISYICNEYSRSLDRTKYHITVAFLFGTHDPRLAKEIDADTVTFLDCPRRETAGLRIKAIRKLIHLCKKNSYDFVICHRYKAAQMVSIVRLFCNIPYVLFTVHTMGYMRDIRRKMFAFLFFRRFFYIAISNAIRADLLETGIALSERSVITIHNTLDICGLTAEQLDKASARARLGLASTEFIFGTVGRLVAFKDHATLIKAFALVHHQLKNTRLVIIGAGNLEAQLKGLAEFEGLNDDVIFHGKVPNASHLMRAFDVFVLSSIREPFGLVLLEAMAASRPIICSSSGGPPEIVGSFAMMVSDHSPQGFARQMMTAYRLTDVEREDAGRRGYDHLRKHFANSTFAQCIAALERAP